MNIGWPEGIWLALNGLGFIGMAFNETVPKERFVWWSFTQAGSLGLLYWGGFFS